MKKIQVKLAINILYSKLITSNVPTYLTSSQDQVNVKLFQISKKKSVVTLIFCFCIVLFFFNYFIYFFFFILFLLSCKLFLYLIVVGISKGLEVKNKLFIMYVIICNIFFYGIMVGFYVFFKTAFGWYGGTLLAVLLIGIYCFDTKETELQKLVALDRKNPNLNRCVSIMVINFINFFGYLFLVFFFNLHFYETIIEIILLASMVIGIYFSYVEIKYYIECNYGVEEYKSKRIKKEIINFWNNYPGYAISFFITGVRILVMIICEVMCLRYGITGGMLLMGGPGMCFTPNSVKVGDYVQNVVGVSEFKPVRYIEPLPIIPEKPPKNMNEFVALIANNPQGININEFYNSYEDQYEYFQEHNRMFQERFPANFQEFVSCIRAIMLDAYRTEDPKFNIMITEQQVADYINTFGQPIQVKTVEKITITTIQEALEKPGAVEACIKDNMAIHIFYKQNAIEPENTKSLFKLLKPHYLKTNVRIYDTNVLQRVTPSQVQGLWDYRKEHRGFVQECNLIMRTDGWKHCASYMTQIAKGITKR